MTWASLLWAYARRPVKLFSIITSSKSIGVCAPDDTFTIRDGALDRTRGMSMWVSRKVDR